MADEVKVVPKVEVKPEIKVEAPKVEVPKVSEEKVADILKEEAKTVPEAAFLELKNENKEVWKELKKVQTMVAEGLSKKEVSDTLKQIGEKYKVDPEFLNEVSKAIKAEADIEVDKKVSAKLEPLEKKEKLDKVSGEADRIDRIFKEHYAKTLESMPEFKDIADPDVIKSLTLDPSNSQKTFAQILEKAYGHLVKGKGKTLDSAQPGGRKEPTDIDYDKASKDSDYFRTIMADPASRKEYNKNLAKRLKL